MQGFQENREYLLLLLQQQEQRIDRRSSNRDREVEVLQARAPCLAKRITDHWPGKARRARIPHPGEGRRVGSLERSIRFEGRGAHRCRGETHASGRERGVAGHAPQCCERVSQARGGVVIGKSSLGSLVTLLTSVSVQASSKRTDKDQCTFIARPANRRPRSLIVQTIEESIEQGTQDMRIRRLLRTELQSHHSFRVAGPTVTLRTQVSARMIDATFAHRCKATDSNSTRPKSPVRGRSRQRNVRPTPENGAAAGPGPSTMRNRARSSDQFVVYAPDYSDDGGADADFDDEDEDEYDAPDPLENMDLAEDFPQPQESGNVFPFARGTRRAAAAVHPPTSIRVPPSPRVGGTRGPLPAIPVSVKEQVKIDGGSGGTVGGKFKVRSSQTRHPTVLTRRRES